VQRVESPAASSPFPRWHARAAEGQIAAGAPAEPDATAALKETRLRWVLARQLDPRWAAHRLRGRSGGTRAPDSAKRWDAQYARTSDLFELDGVESERTRYRFLIGALADRRLGRTLELGCSVGVLTEMLAERTRSLVATDISDVVLETARQRLRDAGHDRVELRQAELPAGVPKGPFDTVVASEVLCYLRATEVAEFAGRMAAALAPHGRLLVAHTRGYFPKHAISADHAARLVGRAVGLRSVRRWGGSELRVDLFEAR
jgi:SAM-dependent methyltransferase